MRNFNVLLTTLIGIVLFSGCTLKKMIQLGEQANLQVEPNPLETHAGLVPFTISADLLPKTLPKNKVYSLNAIYKYGDKSFQAGTVEFKADDFPDSKTTTSRKSASFKFSYQDDFNPGELYLQGVATNPANGSSKTGAEMKVADGIITTSLLVKDSYLSVYAPSGYVEKPEYEPVNVDFYFPQGRSKLIAGIDTDGKTNKIKQEDLSAYIAEKNVTKTVTITGTHSPEGTERINSGLSQDRAAAIESYYRKQMKKYDYQGIADSINFILKPVIENWSALRSSLAGFSSLTSSEKGQYLRVIDGSGTFEDKEKSLQDLPKYDLVFDEVYPTLRAAKTEILKVKPKKSPAQIAVLAKEIAEGKKGNEALRIDELLFAGTMTPDVDEKIAIYTAATKYDNSSWVANNNLAAAYLDKAIMEGANNEILENAMTHLETANNKNSGKAEVHANKGSVLMMQTEYLKAEESLNSSISSGASSELNSDISALLGVISIRKGDYPSAVTTLASATTSDIVNFNRGLASILSGDYPAADTYLSESASSSSVEADFNYLRAVTAARSGDAGNVTVYLKKAIASDKDLISKALSDLEFLNFKNEVQEAIK